MNLGVLQTDPEFPQFGHRLLRLGLGQLELRLHDFQGGLRLLELLRRQQFLVEEQLGAVEVGLGSFQLGLAGHYVGLTDGVGGFRPENLLLEFLVLHLRHQRPDLDPVAHLEVDLLDPAGALGIDVDYLLGLQRTGQHQLLADVTKPRLGEVHVDQPTADLLLGGRIGQLVRLVDPAAHQVHDPQSDQ